MTDKGIDDLITSACADTERQLAMGLLLKQAMRIMPHHEAMRATTAALHDLEEVMAHDEAIELLTDVVHEIKRDDIHVEECE